MRRPQGFAILPPTSNPSATITMTHRSNSPTLATSRRLGAALSLTLALTWPALAGDTTPRLCDLVRVTDGDTLRLSCDSESLAVRLYCIDAPEMAQTPWGTAARRGLERLASKRLELTTITTDFYGRTIGELRNPATGLNLGLELVKSGHVAVYRGYCDSLLYKTAQLEAKDAGFGIWSVAGNHQAPWDYRDGIE